MLKKLILALSLVAALAIGGGAMATSASAAANCLVAIGPTFWSPSYGGVWAMDTQLQNCYDVDMVEYSRGGVSGTWGTGWWDLTANVWHPAPSGQLGNLDDYLSGRYDYRMTNAGVVTWRIKPFCTGRPPGTQFVVSQVFTYRIHNIGYSQSTWGPWHTYFTENRVVGC